MGQVSQRNFFRFGDTSQKKIRTWTLGTLLFVQVRGQKGQTGVSQKYKNVDEKECPQCPSITKALQKYYKKSDRLVKKGEKNFDI